MSFSTAAISRKDFKTFQVAAPSLPRGKSSSLRLVFEAITHAVTLALKICILALCFTGSLFLGKESYAYIFQADYFSVNDVVISGLVKLKEEDLLNISGIRQGRNTFRLDLEAISKQIMANPWVEQVSVRRELPKSLAVDVKEREPFAKVFANGKLFLIDEKGYVMARVENNDYKTLPVIGGFSMDKQNDEGLYYPRIFMAGLKLLKFSRESNLFRAPIAGVRIENRNELTLIAPGGKMEIRVDARNLAEGLPKLEAIFDYARMEGKTIKFIDLSFRKKAVVRFAEEN